MADEKPPDRSRAPPRLPWDRALLRLGATRQETVWWNSSWVIGIATFAAIAVLAAPRFPLFDLDNQHYIAMALGHRSQVIEPFIQRNLAPALAGVLMRLPAVDVMSAFALIGILSLAGWISTVVGINRASACWPGFLSLTVLVTPTVLHALETTALPDMLSMAGVGAILWLLRAQRYIAVAVALAIFGLARESFLLLSAIALVIYAVRREVRPALLILAGSAIGFAVNHHLSAGSANFYAIPQLEYLAFKVPARFVINVLGIGIWTDVYKLCAAPFVTIDVPVWSHLGNIHRFGFCAPNLEIPLITAAVLASKFGVLPAILAGLLAGRARPIVASAESWWLLAFWFGAAMTVLGILTGGSVDRLLGYGWPLFLVALPALCTTAPDWPPGIRARLLALNLLVAWPAYDTRFDVRALWKPLHGGWIHVDTVALAVSLLLGLAGNFLAYRMVRPHRATLLPTRAAAP